MDRLSLKKQPLESLNELERASTRLQLIALTPALDVLIVLDIELDIVLIVLNVALDTVTNTKVTSHVGS